MVAAAVLTLVLASLAPAAGADLSGFAFQPHPGARLPLGSPLFDENGHRVALGQFFGKRPVVVVLDYLRCKTLCGVTLRRVAAALDALPLDAGRDYEVVAVSIDPRDTPSDLAAAKAKDTGGYNHPGADAGWHFLGGPENVVRRIADTVGFPHRYDPALDQYLHPAGFVVAAPDGTISHYLLGVDPSPAALRSALADAKAERAVGPLTRLLLLCHGANPRVGRYTLPVEAAFILANFAAFFGAVAVFAAIWRRRHG
ncbi:MAG TPA: SCO family protein [Stellaceae bacterium]|jgi:protein SCO1/2|nr:SCO family protein [Stellaceae bacterium]